MFLRYRLLCLPDADSETFALSFLGFNQYLFSSSLLYVLESKALPRGAVHA